MKTINHSIIIMFLAVFSLNAQTDSIVFYLPFEGNVEDSSVNKVAFTVSEGAVDYDENGPFGQSLVLNTTVLLSDADVFNIGNTHTMAMWIKSDQVTDGNMVFLHQKDGTNPGRVHVELFGGSSISSFTGGVNDERTTCSDLVEEGTWYHVATVFDKENGEKLLYVDGELKDSKPLTSTEECSAEFVIGSFKTGGSYVIGGMDELVLYNKALSQNDIQKIMNEGVIPEGTVTSINIFTKDANSKLIDIVYGKSKNEMVLKYEGGVAANYSIYNISGKSELNGISYSGQSLFLNALSPGIYLIKVKVNSQLAIKKIIVK
jgi:hypothetical protein